VTAGEDTTLFKLTLDAAGNTVNLIDSNFVTGMGTGNGRMTLDSSGSLFLTIGTGLDRVGTSGSSMGKRINVLSAFEGNSPMVGLAFAENALYLNQLGSGSLFKVSP
jgi:hypothetical protein